MSGYAVPEVVVDVEWAQENLDNPSVRFVEVDVDNYSYEEGHIPGAVGWNWSTQLCDQLTRDILSKEALEALLSAAGISRDTTVVVYGDNNNWFAAWAFWQLKIYGHADVRLLNGGRRKWLESGLELTDDAPSHPATSYQASEADDSLRAWSADIGKAVHASTHNMIDVRSPAEFTGELLSPPGLPETCQRGGHVPGASNIPWGRACNEDGTFKSYDDLVQIYEVEGNISPERPTIAYCRIGERSSHSWFVAKYLLGHDDVTNYDGSWTEWGNLVGVAIERG